MAFASRKELDEEKRRSYLMTMLFHLGRAFRVTINPTSGTGGISIPRNLMDELKIVQGDSFHAVPFQGKDAVVQMADNGMFDKKSGVIYIRKEASA